MIPRVTDWERRAAEAAYGLCGQVYRWGETDCVSCWRRIQSAMRGVEDALPVLGSWSSPLAAGRRLAGLDVVATLQELGASAHPAGFAQTGDLLYTPDRGESGPSFVTVVGRQVLLSEPQRRVTMTYANLLQRHALGAQAWRLP